MRPVVLTLKRQQRIDYAVAAQAPRLKLMTQFAQRIACVAQHPVNLLPCVIQQLRGTHVRRRKPQRQRQQSDKHAGGVFEMPARTVQTWHADHQRFTSGSAPQIQCQRREKTAKCSVAALRGLAAKLRISGSLQGLRHHMRWGQSSGIVSNLAWLAQGGRQCLKLPLPIRRIARKGGGMPVLSRCVDEMLVGRTFGRGHGLALRQRVVNHAPPLYHQRGAPAIHDQVMKLDGQALQSFAGTQPRKAPRRLRAQGKGVSHATPAPFTHGGTRIRRSG